MSGEIELRPGFQFSSTENEAVTLAKLNRLVNEIVARIMAGSVTSRELADGSITSDKLDSDITAQLGVNDNSITTAKLVDDAVTNAKLAEMSPLTVKCNPVNAAGNPQDLQATTDNGVLARDGAVLKWQRPGILMKLTGWDAGTLTSRSLGVIYGPTTCLTLINCVWKATGAAHSGLVMHVSGSASMGAEKVLWGLQQIENGAGLTDRAANTYQTILPTGLYWRISVNEGTPQLVQSAYYSAPIGS